jgi:hypothetical protein
MKKLLLFLIALLFAATSVWAEPIITTIGTPTAVSCGVYDVNVTVQDFTNVGAISLVLNFNPNVLQLMPIVPPIPPYQGVTLNGAILSALVNGNIPGQFRLGFDGAGTGITLAPGTVLFTLHFTLLPAISGTPTSLTWSAVPGECEYSAPTFEGEIYASTFNGLINWAIPVRPVKNTTTLLEYCSIQAAISDPLTSNGHTITVAAGNYPENVTITKSLTIDGTGKGLTKIVPPALISTGIGHRWAANVQSGILVNGAAAVTLKDMTIDGNSLTPYDAVVFWNASSGSMENLEIKADAVFSSMSGHGLAVDVSLPESVSLTVTNCDFPKWNRNAIDAVNGNGTGVNGGNITINITGGTLSGRNDNIICLQNGINLWNVAGGSVNSVIDGVTIKDLAWDDGTWESYAIAGTDNNGVIIKNTVMTNVVEYIGAGYGDIDATLNNSLDLVITGFATLPENFAIEDKIYHKLDDFSYGLVTWNPLNDYVTMNSGSIQRGVDAAGTPGWTVNVNNGLYKESNITVNKALTIQGASTNAVLSPAAADANIDGSWGTPYQYGFLIGSSNVKIKNMTIDGEANTSLGLGHNFRAGVMTDHRLLTLFNNIEVSGLIIKNTYRKGIQIYSGLTTRSSGHVINGNEIDDVTLGPAINIFDGDVTMIGNTINNVPGRSGIEVVQYSAPGPVHSIIQGNILTNVVSGIQTVWSDGTSRIGGPNPADPNTINLIGALDINGDCGAGIIFRNADGGATVQNNVVSGSSTDAGIWMYDDGTLGNPVVVTGNILTATSSSSIYSGYATGIFITNDGLDYFEPGNDQPTFAVISNNTISGFQTGVNLFGYGYTPTIAVVSATIVNNHVTGSTTGILAYDYNGATGGYAIDATINNNNLGGNSTLGLDVSSLAGTSVDAECNWWGVNDVLGVGAEILGPADYEPWLIDGSDIGDPGFIPGVSCSGATNLYVNDLVSDNPINDIYTTAIGDDDDNPGTAAAPFLTITKAVNTAVNGTNIWVDAGTFQEQVLIGKTVDITGVDRTKTIVKAPSIVPDVITANPVRNPIVCAKSPSTSSLITVNISNLKIDGDNGRNSTSFVGMYYYAANGTFDNAQISDIHDVGSVTGSQRGVAFYADHDAGTTLAQTVTISNSIIDNYQKGGIVMKQPGTIANVTGNTVTWLAGKHITAPNGIQISNDATGTVTGNEVSGNVYNGPGNWTATGILLFSPASGTITIGSNNVHGNETAIYLTAATGYIVNPNTFSDNDCHIIQPGNVTAVNTYDKWVLNGTTNPFATDIVYGKIQCAIDWSDPLSILNTSTGIFDEQVVINKTVDLRGPKYGVSGYDVSRGTGEAIIKFPLGLTPNAVTEEDDIVNITADDVIIDGFTVDGQNYDPLGNYQAVGIMSVADNSVIRNNRVFNSETVNIWVSSYYWDGSTWATEYRNGAVIENNYTANTDIFNRPDMAYAYGIYVQGAYGDVLNNVVEDCRAGIQVQPYNHPNSASDVGTVSGNSFEGYSKGMYFNYSQNANGNWQFINNTVSGIAPPIGVSITEWDGIAVQTYSGGLVNFSENSITFGGAVATNKYTVKNFSTLSFTATCNWHGTADGAIIAPKISGNVSYAPWLVNGFDNNAGPGFQPVPGSCIGTPIVFTCATDKTEAACQTQGVINSSFAAWLLTTTASGCSGTLTTVPVTPVAPSACGGYVDVIWTYTSDCEANYSCTKRFTVTAPATLTIACPTDPNLAACSSAGDIATAYAAWVAGFQTSGGCNVTTNIASVPALPDLTNGGQLTFNYQVTSSCAPYTLNCNSTFTVDVKKTLSGTLTYNNALKPLNGITLTLVETGATSTTASGGNYSFTSLCPGTYTITASDDKAVGGINATDAAQVNAWNVVGQPAGPWPSIEKVRFFAGDAALYYNNLDANDASRILGYFVTAGNLLMSPEWKFWWAGDMTTVNPYAGSTTISVTIGGSSISKDIYGLCTGDFNGSFTPGAAKSASESLTLNYGKTVQVSPGSEFELPVYAGMDMEVGAVSLIMNFPSDNVEITGVFLTSDPSSPLLYNVSGDELRIGWTTLSPVWLNEGEGLITLKMKVNEPTGNGSIYFSLAGDPLNELADGNYEVIGNAVLTIDVVKASALGFGENSLAENLTLSNHPNPFNGTTTFVYSIPVDGKVLLEIYDLLGNKVKVAVDETQSAGTYSLKLDANQLQPGVYTATIKLKNTDTAITRTIKIISK